MSPIYFKAGDSIFEGINDQTVQVKITLHIDWICRSRGSGIMKYASM